MLYASSVLPIVVYWYLGLVNHDKELWLRPDSNFNEPGSALDKSCRAQLISKQRQLERTFNLLKALQTKS